jgi:hypothetical protein
VLDWSDVMMPPRTTVPPLGTSTSRVASCLDVRPGGACGSVAGVNFSILMSVSRRRYPLSLM